MPANDRPWDRDDDDDDRPRRRDEYDDRPPTPKSNGLATAGLILGILAFCTVGLTALPGLICSALALGKPTGRGAAIAGLVLSLVGGLVGAGLGVGLLMYSVQKVRESAVRMSDQNNLKQIALGVHNYASSNRDALPPADGTLSWRVHLLPYVEEDMLYRRFNVDQSWDSVNNKPLASQRVRVYTSVEDTQQGSSESRYRVFVGPNTLHDPNKKGRWTIGNIPDGTSNTIFAVEAAETVPWSQPKELKYERNGPLPALGFPHRKGFSIALMDGSVRFVSDQVSPDVLRAGIEPSDGKFFNP